MSDSSVPAIQFTPTGVVVPQETDIVAGVLQDMNAAFGGRLRTTLADGTLNLETPQGQLASSTAAIIGAKNDEVANIVNMIDPDTSSGRWQDAIARIYFLDRLPAVATVVSVQCVGASGTNIPTGATVADTAGNIYSCTGGGTIPSSGTITLQFQCNTTGPIACPAGSIVGPYKAIPGWDTASNSADGVIGRGVESPADFEYRRKNSVALNGAGSLPNIYANVFAVPGVTDVYCDENVTDNPVTKGSVTLQPHSVYVAAVGGLDADVAAAIWRKHNNGANYSGNTTVQVQDTSGYSVPYPTYAVTFQRPTDQPVYFNVQVANVAGLPSDIVTQVQTAIVNAFNGGDGGPRVRIGSIVYGSRFYAPVVNIKPGYVEVLSLQLGLTAAGANQNSLQLDIGSVPTISAGNVTVTLV